MEMETNNSENENEIGLSSSFQCTTMPTKKIIIKIKKKPNTTTFSMMINAIIFNSYITKLNELIKGGFTSVLSLIKKVHEIYPELKIFCEKNKDNFKITSVKDKGLLGKIIEFYLFGNLPNNNSCPDTSYGDVKTTHFKELKFALKSDGSSKAFNAKERVTLTNFGDPNNEQNQNIIMMVDKNSIKDTKFYEKIKTGILLVLQHDDEKYDTIESVYNKKLLAIVSYDLDEIFEKYFDISNIFQNDFNVIKKGIIDKNVTQRGQQYLHIHKHGGKNCSTRAFGFTNKFVTRLVSICLNIPICSKGRVEYIEL